MIYSMFLKTNTWLVNEMTEDRKELMRRINDSEEATGEHILEGGNYKKIQYYLSEIKLNLFPFVFSNS
jgi:hypothetical protein